MQKEQKKEDHFYQPLAGSPCRVRRRLRHGCVHSLGYTSVASASDGGATNVTYHGYPLPAKAKEPDMSLAVEGSAPTLVRFLPPSR